MADLLITVPINLDLNTIIQSLMVERFGFVVYRGKDSKYYRDSKESPDTKEEVILDNCQNDFLLLLQAVRESISHGKQTPGEQPNTTGPVGDSGDKEQAPTKVVQGTFRSWSPSA